MSESWSLIMHKQYPIDQSPLYKLVGLKQLERCLSIDLNKLSVLLRPSNYRTWANEKGRAIQHPVGWLAQVHSKIARYLSRIETPDYVNHKKGCSHVKNAREHIGFYPVAKTDVYRYYPSISRAMLKLAFIKHFRCSVDVANILADICSYQQSHLPTGSPISGYLAFWSCKDLFDKVHQLCKLKECTFTLYVDDLTVSGNAANKNLLKDIRQLIKSAGLTSRDSKSKTFPPNAAKLITGVIVKGNNCLLPNRLHKEIADSRASIERSTDATSKEHLKRSLKGRLMAAKLVTDAYAPPIVESSDLVFS